MSEGFPTQTNESLPIEQAYQPQFSKEERVDDYLQAHPNAVQDPREAEVMAHASQLAEEAVVKAVNKAEDDMIAGRNTHSPLQHARLMRESANVSAAEASRVFRAGQVIKGNIR